jgi:hypothetical protein
VLVASGLLFCWCCRLVRSSVDTSALPVGHCPVGTWCVAEPGNVVGMTFVRLTPLDREP